MFNSMNIYTIRSLIKKAKYIQVNIYDGIISNLKKMVGNRHGFYNSGVGYTLHAPRLTLKIKPETS